MSVSVVFRFDDRGANGRFFISCKRRNAQFLEFKHLWIKICAHRVVRKAAQQQLAFTRYKDVVKKARKNVHEYTVGHRGPAGLVVARA